jgi:hypothetical protein
MIGLRRRRKGDDDGFLVVAVVGRGSSVDRHPLACVTLAEAVDAAPLRRRRPLCRAGLSGAVEEEASKGMVICCRRRQGKK